MPGAHRRAPRLAPHRLFVRDPPAAAHAPDRGSQTHEPMRARSVARSPCVLVQGRQAAAPHERDHDGR